MIERYDSDLDLTTLLTSQRDIDEDVLLGARVLTSRKREGSSLSLFHRRNYLCVRRNQTVPSQQRQLPKLP